MSLSRGVITLCLTVAICGLLFAQRIVAIILPPKAGLVCSNCLELLSIASPVQSAVSPVFNSTATLGIKDLPIEVAPHKTISGLCSFMIFTKA